MKTVILILVILQAATLTDVVLTRREMRHMTTKQKSYRFDMEKNVNSWSNSFTALFEYHMRHPFVTNRVDLTAN